ncbi:hypothetical protein O9G_005144 [Rozella allomycis CSF55]|uniref:Uncharacterized protein n=2 Tax=Rozella allomycis (strain CSF55) TaxID=988480 RepID=A0A075AZF1_ROZAC|nr:hypothetical protein O9G_005144 [Rozella allomycis CSF55]|eukprot:EPZ35607.1 hypothetical protein O9G_005144 [Rozella allomycis CSF55]
MDFQEIFLFLQNGLPTKEWSEKEIEIILSQAFMWKSLFQNAQSHLSKNAK